MFPARGQLLSLTDQARLHLDARANISAGIQGARSADGLCREPGRRHQHEGPALRTGRTIRAMAETGAAKPLLPAVNPARGSIAGDGLRLSASALILGQIP